MKKSRPCFADRTPEMFLLYFLLHPISMPTTLKKGIVHPLGLFECLPANEDRAVQLHHSVGELLRPGLHQKLKIWG